MMQDYNYDFIICDVRMPRMNGLELKRLVRASPRFREPPFLMVSGEVSEKTMALAMETKFDGYLYKPFHSAALEQWLLKLAGVAACVLFSACQW
jgi:two-component system chemotaxis response regulator CheY